VDDVPISACQVGIVADRPCLGAVWCCGDPEQSGLVDRGYSAESGYQEAGGVLGVAVAIPPQFRIVSMWT
jgi:hypothetical protein